MSTGTITLWCEPGGHEWQRPRIRGPKPHSCPEHGGPALPLTAVGHASSPMVREDIDDRRHRDREENPCTLGLLRGRLAAVEQAHAHSIAEGPWELRQMLVDLAAAAEQWAATLPEPGALTSRQLERRRKAAA